MSGEKIDRAEVMSADPVSEEEDDEEVSPRSWVHELYVLDEPDGQPRIGRPAEQPVSLVASYLPFLLALGVGLRRYGKHVGIAVVLGTSIFALTAGVAGGVWGVGVALSAGSGFVSVVGAGVRAGISWGMSNPWGVLTGGALVYSGHVYTHSEYLRKLRRDEDGLLSVLSEQVPLEDQESYRERWLEPSTRSLRMRERTTGLAYWMELAVWSGVGLVLGAHLIVLATESATLGYLERVGSIWWLLGYAVVAVLISRTLHVALIEDAVSDVEVPGHAAGWRLGARLPLVYLGGVIVLGVPAGLDAVWSTCLMLGTAVVGGVYAGWRVLTVLEAD